MTSSSSRLTERQRHLFSAASESIFSCNIRRTCHLSPRPPCRVLAFDSVAGVLQGKGDVTCSVLLFCLQSQKDPMLVEKIMNDLDSNKDNEVDFNEFVVLVAALTVACNDFFQQQNEKK